MAMINCPECGQTVSDKAEICIHCGAPLKEKPAAPVYVTFPKVSTLVGRGTVYYNGKSESCAIGGTVQLKIKEPTEISVKMAGYFGNPSITVEPGDNVSVNLNPLGKISLSKVAASSGNNFSSFW